MSSEIGLLLVHGWGCGPGIWRPLMRHFPGHPVCRPDLGFFGARAGSVPSTGEWVAIGHSLGFLWLLTQLPLAPPPLIRALVAINGFSRFSHTSDFPQGVPLPILRRMMTKLRQQPSSVLYDFLQRSGWASGHGVAPITATNPDIEALAQGLCWLMEWDGRPVINRLTTLPLLVLAAQDDQIVPPPLTEAAFAATPINWSATGGHLLPLTRSDWCALQLRLLLRTLAP
ncbi:MAG: alpha/beta hydrolase [Magnetococcales bacterium]|nr:alpha/beta hydrolase [Magnetococcales bacterium]